MSRAQPPITFINRLSLPTPSTACYDTYNPLPVHPAFNDHRHSIGAVHYSVSPGPSNGVPEEVIHHNILGTAYLSRQNWADAEAEFRKAWDSFPVELKIQRARKLAARYKLTGVPALGVNGKYKTGTTMVNSYSQVIQVLDELVAKESAVLGH